jgi:hypothetical protein
MKTKGRAIAALATLLMALPLFGMPTDAATVKPHKVTLKNLTVDSFDPSAKTITAHDGSSVSYTIDASKAKFTRASGEKVRISNFLEIYDNDSITVWGKTTDGININASKVKNNNTRKIKGLYLGTIVDITPVDMDLPGGIQGAVLMVKKDNQISEVLTYGYTKFWFGKTRINYTDLQEGDVVTIQGIMRNFTDDMPFDLIYNTTKIKARRHGAVPSFPIT